MELIVNGELKTVDCTTIINLLTALQIDPRKVAVELNKEIVPKNLYQTTNLNAGDRIEIVHFVGGG